ncbi:MAG: zinc ribbon domain-containing protein [bacterium]
MLNSNVLVLNRSYMPIHVTSVRRAFSLIYQEAARAVDEQYATFDFEAWMQLEVAREMDSIGTSSGPIRVPRVILLASYDRIRANKGGLAVASVAGGVCQGCNQRIPRQTHIDIRKNEVLFFCQGCSRILFHADDGLEA